MLPITKLLREAKNVESVRSHTNAQRFYISETTNGLKITLKELAHYEPIELLTE